MSVKYKRDDKKIGAEEFEALRASIMAEVEAAPKPKKVLFQVSAITLFQCQSKAKSGTKRKAILRATWYRLTERATRRRITAEGNTLQQIRINGRLHQQKKKSENGRTLQTEH